MKTNAKTKINELSNWQTVEFHTNTITHTKKHSFNSKTKKKKQNVIKKKFLCEGALSKPKQIKSVIGLFRRESTTSGSVAGSDPCLAAALTELAMTPPSANQPSTVAGASYLRSSSISGAAPSAEHHERHLAAIAARADRRRSISICAVTPIDESTEMMGVDPLGALIEFKNNDRHNKVENICKNNRRRSLFELTG